MINRARADRPRQRKFTPEQVELIYFGDPNYDEKGHFLAFREDELVGEAYGYIDPEHSAETVRYGSLKLSVLPEYRRMGIGKKLVKEVCEYLRRRNVKEVQTEVPAACQGSRRFYDGLGFSICNERFELAYDLREDLPSAPLPTGYTVRSPEFPDDKMEFLQVWNQANEEVVMTPEAFDTFLSFPGVQSGCFVAERESDCRIIGVLSSYIDPDYNQKKRSQRGHY
jgi:ribosomal protein S18 acetylase RimI-like enzyme